MYKNKEKQRESNKESARRYRDKQKGVTSVEGVTTPSWKEREDRIGEDGWGNTPDIIDKLTDPRWRNHLEKVCSAFKVSSNPSYSKDVRLGDTNLSVVCDWLECTA